MDIPADLQTNASLLIFEIGNSHICVGTSIGQQIRTQERFALDWQAQLTADGSRATPTLDPLDPVTKYARTAWDALPEDRIKALVAASVVPQSLASLRQRLSELFESPLLTIGQELHRPMSLAVEHPERVGIDRVCSAAAAYDVIGRACVAASFGTAITIDCVNDEGVFMGGAILPGVALQARSLHEGTAALPLVKIEATHTVYGASTEEAITNGVLLGIVGALREIVERYATDLHSWPQLVATGGNAELIAGECDFVDNVVPDLCLRGIALAYRKHFADFDD